CVDGDVDELLDLRVEHARPPGNRREVGVRREEVLVGLEQAVPEGTPVAATLDEVVAELLLAFRQLGAHRSSFAGAGGRLLPASRVPIRSRPTSGSAPKRSWLRCTSRASAAFR